MERIYKGSAFKNWFLNKSDVRRVLKPTRDSFYLFKSLDEIEDDKYYKMTSRQYGEVVLEEVILIQA